MSPYSPTMGEGAARRATDFADWRRLRIRTRFRRDGDAVTTTHCHEALRDENELNGCGAKSMQRNGARDVAS
jgi:hypothetical protein